MKQVADLKISELKRHPNGIYIAAMTRQQLLPAVSSRCSLCLLLDTVKLNVDDLLGLLSPSEYQAFVLDLGPEGITYKLRAFSFLATFNGISPSDVAAKSGLGDATNLAVVPGGFDGEKHGQALKSLNWAAGHLFYCSNNPKTQEKQKSPAPRVIPPKFDVSLAQSWIQFCQDHHNALCSGAVGSPVPRFRVVDCMSRQIVWAPPDAKYVTLSYVWGPPRIDKKALGSEFCNGGFLPSQLPKVVEDTMNVAAALGYRYLWVDKYCMDQNSPEKHAELRHMDFIYNRSDVTIIQVAGEDENAGLPGVGNTERDNHS
jgi:hypothetical protein